MTKIIVFDIDGTLADVTHRRHWVANKPKNWAAWNAGMSADPVHEDIRWILMKLRRVPGSKTILCSGRGEVNREVTEQWLSDNRIPYEDLYMRKAKDYRQDYIVKVELLARIRKEHGEPFMWFDDRQQVVDAIRAEGVRVLQVAPGDF
jgi:FMN phosphatase YigB (HAD superfamily)